MNEVLKMDSVNMAAILHAAKQLAVTYLNGLDERPVSIGDMHFDLPDTLPEKGLGALKTQQMFENHFLQNIVAASGGRYWGYVTGGTTPASIAGDWLASVFDQNTQNPSGAGDVSAALELRCVQLLLDLFNLPDDFIGGFVTGATMSNFTALAAARQWWGRQSGKDIAREGIREAITIYASVPHSSSIKSLSMLGMGSSNVHIIPSLPDRECMDISRLENVLASKPQEPFLLISSAGTVNTVDFDDLRAIAALKLKYRFWWHIDAAFGGFAACSRSHCHLLEGWEKADSITIDFHKWLNVPYDSAMVFTRREHSQLQMQTFQNSNAAYLGNPLDNFNYLNFIPENSRRFRALPVWFSLMAYGKTGYRDIVENSIELAKYLGSRIQSSSRYRLMAPVLLNTVCFTWREDHKRKERIASVLQELHRRARVFMTPTLYQTVPCIRAALVNWRTTKSDIETAIGELIEIAEIIK